MKLNLFCLIFAPLLSLSIYDIPKTGWDAKKLTKKEKKKKEKKKKEKKKKEKKKKEKKK